MRNLFFIGLLALVTMLGLAPAKAQSDLRVQVLDSATNTSIPGATVRVEGTTLGGNTDMEGIAVVHGLPDGSHVLHVSFIGYRTRKVRVTTPINSDKLVVKLGEEAMQLGMVNVTATRTSSRIEDAPQKIEVLGFEDLLEEGSLKPGSVASLIGDISSVQVQQTSVVSSASVVRMQGLEGRHTLLLRDGMPAYGGLSGGFDLLRIPPLDLQRIEVIKGPSSTFNGGGAIAGAINFVTKEPGDTLNGLVMLNRSSLTETNANAYISGPLGKMKYTLFAGGIAQEAIDVDGDGYSDIPKIRGYQLHPQLFFDAGKRTHVRTGLWWQREDRTGGEIGAIDAPVDTAHYFGFQRGDRLSGDVLLEHTLKPGSTITVKGSANGYTQEARDNFGAAQRHQSNRFTEAFWSRHAERHDLVLGASYVGTGLRGDGADQELTTVGAFGQLALHRKRWPEIDLGLRVDHNAQYGTQVLPAVAALYKVSDAFTLRANAGTGYQWPDLSKGYGPVASAATATRIADGTVAERSTGATVEWTWKKRFGEETTLFVDQTFFGTVISDPLGTTTTGTDVVLGNVAASRFTRGFDNYVRLKHRDTELYVGYTFTLPEDRASGSNTTIAYTPLHRMAMTLSHELTEHWRAGIEAAYNGQQQRFDGTSTRDQWFVAAMIGYRTGQWNIVLNGENVTDTRQTRWEPIVFPPTSRPRFAPLWAPIEGRVVNLSVLWKF